MSLRCDIDVIEHMRYVYASNSQAWYVAFSGGKDSTTVLQLVYRMLLSLPVEQRNKHVYVLTVDTGVENPRMLARVHKTLSLVEESATRDNLPITTHILRPTLQKTFWVQMLGHGLSPPRYNFRWCTGDLKIRPQKRFVHDLGAVIAVVGDRAAESVGRSARLRKSGINAGNYIVGQKYSPIADWSDVDVFSYLRSDSSPWGDDNSAFLDEFYGASSRIFAGCIRAYSSVAPRMGCWVCTVADGERTHITASMKEYRALLLSMRDIGARLPLETRKFLLDRLLALPESECGVLITSDEVKEIHKIWREIEDK